MLLFATKRSEIDLKYQNKLKTIKNIHNQEMKKLYDDSKNNKEIFINKQILLLKNKLNTTLKLKKYAEAEEIAEELKNENKKLKDKINKENLINMLLKEKNLKLKQEKKINEIISRYNKEKNETQNKFIKEKGEIEQKFKNQLKDFEMFKNKEYLKFKKNLLNMDNKNVKSIKNQKCTDYSKNQQFNKSFDISKLNDTSSDSEL